MVAMPHPTIEGVNVFAGADLGHAIKKARNALENSGKEGHARELTLDNLPLSLNMLFDVYKLTPDFLHEGGVQLFPKLSVEIFQLNSSSRLRTPHAMKVHSSSMISMLNHFKSKNANATTNTYDSLIKYIRTTDRFIDVMNGTFRKGCHLIVSANNPHVFELLDHVMFHTKWLAQVGKNKQHYLPYSTYQDICWTALCPVLIARTQLVEGHTIVQRRNGSDICEESFAKKRDKNTNATALGTNQIMAGSSSSAMMNLSNSRKSNTAIRCDYYGFELDDGKVKRIRCNRRNSF